MINMELNEHTAEDVKEVQELRRLGVPEEVIQTAYDNTQAKRQKPQQTSGDLISRSALLEMLNYNKALHTDENGETRQLIAIDVNRLIDYVEKMPTAYDVDKVVTELKEASYQETANDCDPFGDIPSIVVSLNKAINIISAGGKEPTT